MPSYQAGFAGVQTSAAGQSVVCDLGSGYVDLLDLPAGVPGRNVPDLALNGDPDTGYLVYMGGWIAGYGGTSFVAPQLNGIMNVITQAMGSRLGLVNRALYRVAADPGAYAPVVNGPKAGQVSGGWFTDITAGDNLGYPAVAGYDPASGLGSINAYNLFTALKADKGSGGGGGGGGGGKHGGFPF